MKPSPRKHHRVLYLFLTVVAFSLWRMLHRQNVTEWPPLTEPAPDPGRAGAAPDPLNELARDLAERTNGNSSSPDPDPTPSSESYAVKWTDRSEADHVRHERRDLTFDEAVKDAGRMARHSRRYYSGARSPQSPFAELKVYLQCLCGRDVADLAAPHTVPRDPRITCSSGRQLDHE